MNRFINFLPLVASLVLYSLLWLVLQPVLGFNLDSDCVAYLTIAERMAKGDYLTSVNGLWSPLNSALLAMFIKNGYDSWEMAKVLNFIFGAIILIQSYFLFLKFKLNKYLVWYLLLALSIAMVQFVYFQMFGDILQVIFVLSYLFILWSNKKSSITYQQAIFSGIVMGIAYYAKAYSFFFFATHFVATLAWYVFQKRMQWRSAFVVYLIGIFCAVSLMLPWTFALHKKYGEWSLNGFAGKLNMSWYINSAKSFKSSIHLLIPPIYADSPSFWEDPHLSQEHLSSPFTSANHFVKWIFRITHTCIVAIFCFQEISFLGVAILLIAFFYFFFVKNKSNNPDQDFVVQLLIVTITVLPFGYLLMHIETRYIWLNVMLLMILGALLIKEIKTHLTSKFLKQVVFILFATSFTLFPLFQFENLKMKNKELFEISAALRKDNFQGKFTSNSSDAGRMWVIAYLTKSNYYTIEKTDYTADQLLDEMRAYGVRYYFFESENNIQKFDQSKMKKIGSYNNLELFEL